MDTKPGDLLYTRSVGLVGGLIRFGEDIRYHGWLEALRNAWYRLVLHDDLVPESDLCWGNHIVVVGDGYLIEALAQGVTRSPLSKYSDKTALVLPLEKVLPGATDSDRAKVVRFAEQQLALHAQYSWLGIASIIIQLITPTRLDISWDGQVICSALGGRAWEHAGVILPTKSPYTTMPADLRAMVQ